MVAQSNPSFEIWLYYHFNNVEPDKLKMRNHASFKQFVNSTINGGFDNRSMPVEIEKAIENSGRNFQINQDNQPSVYSTEVFKLGVVIVSFVKKQLYIVRKMIMVDE